MDLRRLLIAAVILVAVLDAGTTQFALFFCHAIESNPLQACIVTDPVLGIVIRLASAALVILAAELLSPLFLRAYHAARAGTGYEPPVNLICYGACILGSLPCITGNLAVILS